MNFNKHIVTLIFVLGIFLVPSTSYSCGTKTVKIEKSCCKKKAANDKASKSCCGSSSTPDKDNSCNGKCGNSSCVAALSYNFSFFVYNEIDFINNNFDFSTKKAKFLPSESILSDGFTSIWLIPKIS